MLGLKNCFIADNARNLRSRPTVFEFKGVSEGLSPGIVTFLMFSYPIWIILGQTIFSKDPLTLTLAPKGWIWWYWNLFCESKLL